LDGVMKITPAVTQKKGGDSFSRCKVLALGML